VNAREVDGTGAGVRQEWSPEEWLASWTLVDGDRKLVTDKTGPTRLGFCLMLKLLEIDAAGRGLRGPFA
jgi:hypothetical protein